MELCEKHEVKNEEMKIQKPESPEMKMSNDDCTDFTELFPIPEMNVQEKGFSNTYVAKKTVAQGMMDIALITANANQLRFLLEFKTHTTTFYIVLMLIIISMCLQVIVGIFLIFKGRFDLRKEKLEHAIRLNNYIVFAVFLITIINVFIAAFSVDVFISGQPVSV